MSQHHSSRYAPWVATLAAACITSAFAVTPAEKPYVGGYTQGSVDTRSQLMLLDDNTFCFTFMGGSLDMLAGGRWKAESNGVRLQEVRQNGAIFPAFGKQLAEQKGSVAFDFHGYSLSNATSAVFATSSDDALPTTMRPLFKAGQNNWSESYKLPPLPAAQVRYFYIGDVEVDANRQPKHLRVMQYRRGDANTLAVGYDQAFGNPPLDLKATLKDNVLHVEGSRFGKRDELPEKVLESIRAACIRPALVPGAKRPAEEGSEEEAQDKAAAALGKVVVRNAPLVPVKTFYLPLAAMQGTPYFPGTDK
ncbi:hypothetical protein [Polaromonas sp.]|uniref:hypothetical protein n=1 Tax=Polaromonas sp. TaxID=1869339 RepID=UPI0032651961